MPQIVFLFLLFCTSVLSHVSPEAGRPSSTFLEAVAAGDHATVRIEPWGHNAVRVRIAKNGTHIVENPGALIPPGTDNKGWPYAQPDPPMINGTSIINGNIKAELQADGMIWVTRLSDGAVVLKETSRSFGALNPAGNSSSYRKFQLQKEADCSGGPCCLDLSYWDPSEDANVAISNCHSTRETNQLWHYQAMDGTIRVLLDGKCLTSSETHGVVVEHCTASASQQWLYDSKDQALMLQSTKQCLTAKEEKDGGALYMAACLHLNQQQWTSVPAPSLPVFASDTFEAALGEKIFGFGEHQQGHLDNKNISYDMESCLEYGKSHGGEICLPWIISASNQTLNYGFLWNMPNYGNVSFAPHTTSWVATNASQIDFFVTVASRSSPPENFGSDIMSSYADAVGHTPIIPEYALGYWHSKNRYSSQAELLAAAEGFHNRSINVSIIVIDYHHWVNMGDWSFDASQWPDIPAMMKTLEGYGMKVMVSVWPFSAVGSSSIDSIAQHNYAVDIINTDTPVWWDDNNCDAKCYLYDPTQTSARQYVWSRIKAGYYQYGIKVFWLDAAEPEISTSDAQNAADTSKYSIGTVNNVGMMFPWWHSRMIREGLESEGENETILLTRSAWAGMSRWGAAVWSGDTQSTFQSLQVSIQAGLNIQMSGIGWWTTDIGGYSGGNPSDPTFRELIVRWFQFGVTCPLFRQHGARPTEIWLLGNSSYEAIVKIIALRQTLEPYIRDTMTKLSASGTPFNRPLFWDFPGDQAVWTIKDQYMMGDSFMVAPVTTKGALNRTVYFPSGVSWTHYFSGEVYPGGHSASVPAPLDETFPLFTRT